MLLCRNIASVIDSKYIAVASWFNFKFYKWHDIKHTRQGTIGEMETDLVNGTGCYGMGVATLFAFLQINLAASEVTELALHLYDIPAIPLADPTLIIGRLTAGRKNWRRHVEDALPLGARAHGCA